MSPVVPPAASSEVETSIPLPVLNFRVECNDHKGIDIFFDAVNPVHALRRAVKSAHKWLSLPGSSLPSIEMITLHLLPVQGIIQTFGSPTTKEIHLSLDYIVQCEDRAADEIAGVILHEVAGCFIYNANGSCPGGLVSGMADYVRLKEDLGPPHWRPSFGPSWDAGFETTAYFLAWIDATFGADTIKQLNQKLNTSGTEKYTDSIFEDVIGVPVEELWSSYCESMDGEGGGGAGSGEAEEDSVVEAHSTSPLPSWPMPKLSIKVVDLAHEGVVVFFGVVNPKKALEEAVMASFETLYTLSNVPTNVKEILLVLRSMDGVAYTTGSAAHKEIHFSLEHITRTQNRAKDEIMGVLVHEVVHCYQYDGRGHCPSGLTEGIADYVRLCKELGPPHWRRKGGKEWDMGYEGTAFFLQWIEGSLGKNSTFVRDLNLRMRKGYKPSLFEDLAGKSVDDLWKSYCGTLEKEPPNPPAPVPTHVAPIPSSAVSK